MGGSSGGASGGGAGGPANNNTGSWGGGNFGTGTFGNSYGGGGVGGSGTAGTLSGGAGGSGMMGFGGGGQAGVAGSGWGGPGGSAGRNTSGSGGGVGQMSPKAQMDAFGYVKSNFSTPIPTSVAPQNIAPTRPPDMGFLGHYPSLAPIQKGDPGMTRNPYGPGYQGGLGGGFAPGLGPDPSIGNRGFSFGGRSMNRSPSQGGRVGGGIHGGGTRGL
jgi:hypothetical protein